MSVGIPLCHKTNLLERMPHPAFPEWENSLCHKTNKTYSEKHLNTASKNVFIP